MPWTLVQQSHINNFKLIVGLTFKHGCLYVCSKIDALHVVNYLNWCHVGIEVVKRLKRCHKSIIISEIWAYWQCFAKTLRFASTWYHSRHLVLSVLFVCLAFCVVLCLCVLFVFVLCLLWPTLPVFQDCPFLIGLSVFTSVYLCSFITNIV